MAWSAPRTWVVSEIVTAAMMNSDVRDNMLYLKGSAGTVTFDAGISVTGAITATSTITATSNVMGNQLRAQSTVPVMWLDETDGGVKGAALLLDGGLLQLHRRATNFGSSEATIAAFDISAPASSLVLDSTGRLGIRRASPSGIIHGYDTISGFLKFEADAVAGTAVTLIPNGAGDVLYRAAAMFVVRDSGGGTAAGFSAGTGLVPGGADTILHTSGADSLALRVNADGSVDVRRSAGTTLTFKVSIWLTWL